MPDTLESLLTKDGLFTPNSPDFKTRFIKLRTDFLQFFGANASKPTNTAVASVNKSIIKPVIDGYKAEGGLTHVGLFYGIDPNASAATKSIQLIVRGAGFTASPPTKMPNKVSANRFRLDSSGLSPISDNSDKLAVQAFIRTYSPNFTEAQLTNPQIVYGAYVKLGVLSGILDAVPDTLHISLGFMQGNPAGGVLDCFHLLVSATPLSGPISDINPSMQASSTFDGSAAYSGPKPGCPPFGAGFDGSL